MSGPVVAAGCIVAAAAVAASVATPRVLPRIDDALFRRIGHGAMVAAGVAMFTLSSQQIANLHRAWITHVSPGGENEIQLYWNSGRVIAIEWEPEGYPAFERSVPFDRLATHEQAAALGVALRAAIILVERVPTRTGRYIEVYWRRPNGTSAKNEIAA